MSTAATPERTGTTDRTARGDGSGRLRRPGSDRSRVLDVATMLVLASLAVLISVLGIVRAPDLSALDEYTHIDYSWQIAHGQLPYAGSEIAPEVLADWSCRGQSNAVLPECGTPADHEQYPNGGENYNYWHPPLYYAITGYAAALLSWLPLGLEFVTAARLTGGAWFAAAVVGMFLVVRSWRVSRLVAATAAASLLAIPAFGHASSIVTNDAPSALAGVAALWVLTRVVLHNRLGWVLPAVLTLLVAATKTVNVLGMLSALGVIGLLALQSLVRGDRERGWKLLRIPVAGVLAVVAALVVWELVQSGRGVPGWQSPISGQNTREVVGLPFDEWAPTIAGAFGLTTHYWLQPAIAGVAVTTVARVLNALFTAAPFAGVAVYEKARPERMIAWAALAGAIAAPIVVQVDTFMGSGNFFPTFNRRYAITLIPVTVMVWALICRDKGWRVVPAALVAVCVGAVLLSFAGVL
ncbi:hypothetical protein [Georgenia muralis]